MNKFSKYLLTISLFFSLFSFSGYAENYYFPQKSTTQTELLFVNKQKISKRVISYKKAFADNIAAQVFSSVENRKQSLITYNMLVKVNFDAISKHLDTFEIENGFLQQKAIPQTPNEDNFTTVLG